jgi:hypothetical protein
MSFSKSKINRCFLAAGLTIGLAACASQAPRVSNAALGFSVTSHTVNADDQEQALSAALGSALDNTAVASGMSAKADITIEFVRYNSPIIGLFYGGEHYASLSVKISDEAGSRIAAFPVYVATNGDRAEADSELADSASSIIAAQAANAFMPIKTQPKAIAKPVPAQDVATVEEPVIVLPPADTDAPCVIGADGNCID